jgi:hypothetical protein
VQIRQRGFRLGNAGVELQLVDAVHVGQCTGWVGRRCSLEINF